MFEAPDYLRIGKPTGQCAACGKSLAEAERLASVLVPNENAPAPAAQEAAPPPDPDAAAPPKPAEEEEASFLRHDYCTACWNDLKERAYFSFWIGKRSLAGLPPKKLNKAERNVALAALFDSLADRSDEDPGLAPHLFFLAHLLMKFKIFRWLPAAPHPRTGEPMLRFLKTQTGEEIYVRDVEMSDETIVRVREEVEAYLQQATGQAVKI
jgi:hypothetical protein